MGCFHKSVVPTFLEPEQTRTGLSQLNPVEPFKFLRTSSEGKLFYSIHLSLWGVYLYGCTIELIFIRPEKII